LAGLADRRGIDQRHECRRVRHHDGVEQDLVARLQVGQEEVFLQVVVEHGELGMDACNLGFECVGDRRQQSLDAQRATVRERKGAAPVEVGIVQKVGASGQVGHDSQPPR
jgi:hypothetical protein